MKDDLMVDVQHVTMRFNLPSEKIDSIKEYVIKIFKHTLHFQPFNALNDVSFQVNKGELLGIVGLNGSGKSTMLKVIAGIMKPTEGTTEVYGSVSPLIELGAGFDPDLTGRENVFLNGSVLGYSREFMQSKFDEIVEFAELEDFIDMQIKNYSSGMTARLGFAVATVVQPQILICDEVLAVGDFKFQQKCEERIKTLMSGDTTVILVSHNNDQIRKLCSRAIWLDHGHVMMIGDADEVVDAYEAIKNT